MKPEPPPDVPGKTPWKKLDNAVQSVLNVSKEAVLKEENRIKKLRRKKRPKQKATA